MKIVTIVGARPQFIKAAAVSRAIQVFNKNVFSRDHGLKKRIREILVHTGQHYDYLMDKVFFEELKLKSCDYHLGVGSGFHGEQTGRMLERIEPILRNEKPDMVLVYGDTNTTLAGALAATKMDIPVAHVEAGLRSFDRQMPEEINRLLTDHLSTLLFCPTDEAVGNLAKEGIRNGRGKRWVKNTGDVMYDSILYYSDIAEKKSTILQDLGIASDGSAISKSTLPISNYDLAKSSSPNSKLQAPNYYLATLHRAENTDNPERLRSILKALGKISERHPVILPLHPRTKKMMKVQGLQPKDKNLKLIEPVSYLNMLKLEKNARVILTDSGGIQKEAYWLRVPCVTLRDVTEWGYTTEEGWNMIAGWKTLNIVESVQRVSDWRKRKRTGGFRKRTASGKIVQILLDYLEKSKP